MSWISSLRLRERFDFWLVLGIVLLCVVGFVTLYSASGQSMDSLYRQGIRIGIAIAVMIFMSFVPPTVLSRWTPILYVLGTILLVIVLWVGTIGKGAQRWIDLGVVRIQPSEMMKLVVPMMTAWVLTQRSLPPDWKGLFLALIAIMIPAFLIFEQPDLGTAIMIILSGMVVIFLAGISWRWILGVVIVVLSVAPVLWLYFLHDYQRQRILTLFDPYRDPLGSGYHIIQSMIAIGSGGVHGKGWLQGSQSQLEFIPERSTDFIFAVFSEEFGTWGGMVLMGLYFFIVVRALYIAFEFGSGYSRLLAGSLAMTFFFYVFVNVGMVMAILPVVGVPLPLISYGGTSMVTLLAGFGIIMSIRLHSQKRRDI